MKKKALIVMLVLSLLISGSGIVAVAADNAFVATIDGTGYTSLQAAVDAVKNSTQDGTIVLEKDTAEDIEVGCDVYVDLNGNNIKSVTVNGGVFYGTDSATNDFVSASVNDYGVIGSFTGDVQAAFSPVDDGYGYLMFGDKGTNASFHFVELRITDMVLRPQNEGEEAYNPSLYYKCTFAGDEVVAANVESFGVALSLVGQPSEVEPDQCGYSKFTNFVPGANGNTQQSTLLHGIMKETNANLLNKRNANMKVYGQAYLKVKNSGYVFGNAQNRTLQEQTELANLLWTRMDNEKKAGIREMYNRYTKVMQSWSLSALSASYADVVEDAVTWYQEFQNLPVAEPGMSPEKLREISKDFFRLQLSFKWTPNTTFMYHDTEVWGGGSNKGEFSDYTTLQPNVVYRGLPYCMTGIYHVDPETGEDLVDKPNTSMGKSGSIYKAMNYYDPATGVLDLAAIYARNGAKAVYDVLTSNCGNGLSWGWNRVSNSTMIHDGLDYTPVNGALPVGPYKWNEAEYSTYTVTKTNDDGTPAAWDIDNKEATTIAASIIADNGDQVMYQSYAAMEIGDGFYSGGHLMMCSVKPHIVTVDGSEYDPQNPVAIDPDKSYLYRIDQNANGSTDRLKDNATHGKLWRTQGNGKLERDLGGFMDGPKLGTKVTFRELLEIKYLPITIPEFVTQERIELIRNQSKADFEAADDLETWTTYYETKYQALIDNMEIEEPEVKFNKAIYYTTPVTPTKLTTGFGGSIEANYVISNVRITLQDSNGKVLLEEDPIIHTTDRTIAVKISTQLLPASEILTQETLTQYAGKGNKIIISVQLSTGEWVEALNAELIAD